MESRKTASPARSALPVLLAAAAVLSVYPILWIRTEHNVPFLIAFRWLSVPCLGAAYGVVWRRLRLGALPRAAAVAGTLLVAFLLTLSSAGLVICANMVVPPQEPVRLEGIVRDKFQAGSRAPARVLVLETEAGTTVRIPVSAVLWNAIRPGDRYAEQMTRGGLGFLYRRRW